MNLDINEALEKKYFAKAIDNKKLQEAEGTNYYNIIADGYITFAPEIYTIAETNFDKAYDLANKAVNNIFAELQEWFEIKKINSCNFILTQEKAQEEELDLGAHFFITIRFNTDDEISAFVKAQLLCAIAKSKISNLEQLTPEDFSHDE